MKSFHLPPMVSRNTTALAVKTATIAVAALVIFYQDLAIIMADAVNSALLSYILAIPVLFAYLIYRKRKLLRAVIPRENQNPPRATTHRTHLTTIAGITLALAAILLYWHGSYTFTPLEYHILTLPIFLAGLILLLFNAQTLRQLALPLAFLIFLAPPSSLLLSTLGATLSITSSHAAHTIVKSLGIPTTLTTQYGNPVIQLTRPDGATISFAVDIACSGIHSLIGFLVFAVFVTYVIRDTPWKKLATFLTGLALIYTLNITRITTILLIGYQLGEEAAIQLFHLLGGWILIFLGTLLLLVISERLLHTHLFTKQTDECPACNPTPPDPPNICPQCGKILRSAPIKIHQTDIIKIAAIVASVILLTSIQAPVFAFTQGPAIVVVDTPTGKQTTTPLLPTTPNYQPQFLYRERSFEALLKQDLAMVYLYKPANQSQQPLHTTVEIAATLQNLPKWEICLKTGEIYPLGHQEIIEIDLKDIQLLQNPPVIGRFFVFQYTTTKELQAVLYWFDTATFQVNTTAQQKHVKISLITYPENPQELPTIENQMTTLATQIASYWQPIKTWSQIALLLSQNGAHLAAINIALLATATVLYAIDRRRQRKANAKAYQKLSEDTKTVIEAVHKTTKTPTPTSIAQTYSRINHKTITPTELAERLQHAHETGLITTEIANVQDEPIRVWKTQLPGLL